jgi:hypothetical protein
MIRKIIFIVILALSVFLCYTVVSDGVEIGSLLTISNYTDVQDSSKEIDTLISQLVNVNEIEFKSRKASLTTAIKAYKDAKEEYDEMASTIESTDDEDSNTSLVDIYDVDFLWTVVGNYATEEGITLKMDITKSTTSSLISDNYTICDLKFTISGDYIALTDFIYDIEDDSKLGFEISSFEIAKGGENLQATFTVKEVPINNENLTELQSSVETTTTSSDTNTVTDNATTSTGASSSTTSTASTTTNSVN